MYICLSGRNQAQGWQRAWGIVTWTFVQLCIERDLPRVECWSAATFFILSRSKKLWNVWNCSGVADQREYFRFKLFFFFFFFHQLFFYFCLQLQMCEFSLFPWRRSCMLLGFSFIPLAYRKLLKTLGFLCGPCSKGRTQFSRKFWRSLELEDKGP